MDRGVVVVTGGASGMGEAASCLLAERGYVVAVVDLQRERGLALAGLLGDRCRFFEADASDEDQICDVVDEAMRDLGRLTAYINNAGIIGAVGPLETISSEAWDFTVSMVLRSAFVGIKHAARVMKPLGSGAIVNATSISAFRGGIGPHPYTAAKAGVIALTQNAAAELASFGIRVNAVAPGRIATPMVADTWAGDPSNVAAAERAIAPESPMPDRIGTAKDIAEAYAWLISDAAGYVNGQTLCVDGGVVAGAPPVVEARAKLARYEGGSTVVREGGRRGL